LASPPWAIGGQPLGLAGYLPDRFFLPGRFGLAAADESERDERRERRYPGRADEG
jgi:hypothetical protein